MYRKEMKRNTNGIGAAEKELRNKGLEPTGVDTADTEDRKEVGVTPMEPITTERVFSVILNRLNEMGYSSTSIEKSEDFTERIDGIFTKRSTMSDENSSGYLRILTVYRAGKVIHVEFYNFLREFSSDDVEMREMAQSLKRLLKGYPQVEVKVHA
ncbi:MAG: hypothetical protein WED05_06885 [Candidatus Atabeyarchaeum deiterrae]